MSDSESYSPKNNLYYKDDYDDLTEVESSSGSEDLEDLEDGNLMYELFNEENLSPVKKFYNNKIKKLKHEKKEFKTLKKSNLSIEKKIPTVKEIIKNSVENINVNQKDIQEKSSNSLPKPDAELVLQLQDSGMSEEDQKAMLKSMGFDTSEVGKEVQQGNPIGFGEKAMPDGTFYTGELDINGIPHGFGSIKDFDLNLIVYEGTWEHGIKHGRGKYHMGNGYFYEGEFYKEKLQGEGKYYYKDKILFEGKYDNGSPVGNGKIYMKNGSFFEGHVSADYKGNGNGKIFTKDGTLYYDGYVQNSLPHGKGKMKINNILYEGDFKDGYMDGTYKSETKDRIRISVFSKGKLVNIISDQLKPMTEEEKKKDREESVKTYAKEDFVMIL